MDTATDIEQDTQTEQDPQPKPKLKVSEFAAKIKAKYPEYKDIDDKELTDKIVAKYPDYKEQIDFSVGVKKKETVPTPSESSATPSQSQLDEYHRLVHPSVIPAGQGINQPSSTQSIQPKITASYDDYIAHHEEREAKLAETKQKVIDKAAKTKLKEKGIIKPGEEGKALDVHQFSEFESEKQRLSESLKNKDALITYKDGEPELVEKGHGTAMGYIWNKITDAVGGLSSAAGDITMQLLAKIPAARGDMTEDEVMKQYRAESSPVIRSATTQLVGADVSKEREKDFNGQFLTHAAGSIASMVPAMGFPKGSGFVLQAFDGGLQNINNTKAGKELPESTKTIYATGVGLATGLLMKANLNTIFGKETNNIASGLTANVMADLVKKSDEPITAEVFQAAMQSAVSGLKNKVISAGGKIGKGAITGGIFGSAMEATNIAAEEITNKATGQQVFEPTTWGEKFGRILQGGKEMAEVGGLLGGIQIPFSKTRDYIKEKVGEAKTPEDIQAIKDELIGKVQEKGGTEDAAQQVNDLVDKYVEVYSKIPPESNNKSAIVDNIQERDALANHIDEKTEQLQTVDPAFHEPITQEINASNGRIDEINQEIAEKAAEPPKEESGIVVTPPDSFSKPITIGGEETKIENPITEEVKPEVQKLEQERDTEIKKLEKIEVPKLEYIKEADLVKQKNETELIEEQRDIKKREGQLKQLIKCLTS